MKIEKIRKELLLLAGLEEEELGGEFEFVEIPPKKLLGWKTACGLVDVESHFSARAVHFLSARAEKVWAIVRNKERKKYVFSLAAPLSEEEGEEFSRLVEAAGGSLRPDYDPRMRVCFFESE